MQGNPRIFKVKSVKYPCALSRTDLASRLLIKRRIPTSLYSNSSRFCNHKQQKKLPVTAPKSLLDNIAAISQAIPAIE